MGERQSDFVIVDNATSSKKKVNKKEKYNKLFETMPFAGIENNKPVGSAVVVDKKDYMSMIQIGRRRGYHLSGSKITEDNCNEHTHNIGKYYIWKLNQPLQRKKK